MLSFSENSVDLARAARTEENRYRNAQERTLGELLHPDPAERVPDRDLKRFLAEAHQRLAGPLNALTFALVALATALTGQFRRHGGGFRLFTGIAVVVALLAVGLTTGNLAARQSADDPADLAERGAARHPGRLGHRRHAGLGLRPPAPHARPAAAADAAARTP